MKKLKGESKGPKIRKLISNAVVPRQRNHSQRLWGRSSSEEKKGGVLITIREGDIGLKEKRSLKGNEATRSPSDETTFKKREALQGDQPARILGGKRGREGKDDVYRGGGVAAERGLYRRKKKIILLPGWNERQLTVQRAGPKREKTEGRRDRKGGRKSELRIEVLENTSRGGKQRT